MVTATKGKMMQALIVAAMMFPLACPIFANGVITEAHGPTKVVVSSDRTENPLRIRFMFLADTAAYHKAYFDGTSLEIDRKRVPIVSQGMRFKKIEYQNHTAVGVSEKRTFPDNRCPDRILFKSYRFSHPPQYGTPLREEIEGIFFEIDFQQANRPFSFASLVISHNEDNDVTEILKNLVEAVNDPKPRIEKKMRVWTSKKGSKIKGVFESRLGDTVKVVDEAGKVFTISTQSLSWDDLKYLKSLAPEERIRLNQVRLLTFILPETARCKTITSPPGSKVDVQGNREINSDDTLGVAAKLVKLSEFSDGPHRVIDLAGVSVTREEIKDKFGEADFENAKTCQYGSITIQFLQGTATSIAVDGKKWRKEK